MVRSLYSAVAGLTVHQTRMDVIGNNIANVNTYGFKASRTSFSDIYYQSKKASTGGTAVYAGNNEAAVGYGVEISSIDKDMSTSSFQSSNRVLDLAITNDGFFMVGTVDDLNKINSVAYTRYGNFGVDSAGNLVNTLNQFVLGTANDGKFSSSEMSAKKVKESPLELDTLNVNELVWRAFRDYTEVEYSDVPDTVKRLTAKAPLKQDYTAATATDPATSQLSAPDADGNYEEDPAFDYAWVGYGEKNGKKILYAAGSVSDDDVVVSGVGKFLDEQEKSTPDKSVIVDPTDASIKYNADGSIDQQNNRVSTEILYYVNGRYVNENGVVYDTEKGVYLDNDGFKYKLTKTPREGVNGIDKVEEVEKPDGTKKYYLLDDDGRRVYDYVYTALDGPYAGTDYRYDDVKKEYRSTDGNDLFADMKRGELTYADLDGFSVGANGVMTATYASEIKALARVELGTFDNIEGLEQIGDTQFGESIASGQVKVKSPGSNGAGSLKSSKLEMSNVNLASEFSDMIVTQRGFQANARIVTTSDSMLEELVNLKR